MQVALYPVCDEALIKCLVDVRIIHTTNGGRRANAHLTNFLIRRDGAALVAYVSKWKDGQCDGVCVLATFFHSSLWLGELGKA